jgi:GNAT superfamily N-acetyltransferase
MSGGNPVSRDPGSLSGDPGPMRVFTRWGPEDDRGPRLPWIGIFLVIFGGLLLLERALPAYRNLGNLLVLAAGLAFLVAWALRRGTFALYAGAFLTAAAIPGVLSGLGYEVGPGVGSVSYGIAFLFIAAVRSWRGGGWGWQLIAAAVLLALGLSELALPDLGALAVPLLLVALGVVLLTRGRR